MKHLPAAIFLIVVAIVGWKIGSVLSRDALSMALGVIFGMMAGIPAALIAVSLKRQVPAEQPSNQQGERPLLPAPVPALDCLLCHSHSDRSRGRDFFCKG